MADLESAEVSSSLVLSESGSSDMTMTEGQASSSTTLSESIQLDMTMSESVSVSTTVTLAEAVDKGILTVVNVTPAPLEIVLSVGAVTAPYVYVVDSGNNRVNAYDYDGTFRFSFGSFGSGDGEFNSPYGIATDGTYLYVTDSGNNRVQVFTMTGTYVNQFGSYGAGDGQFDNPLGIAVDSCIIWVIDNGNHRFSLFFTGTYDFGISVGSFGDGSGPDQFNGPTDITMDSQYAYINDLGNARIVQYAKAFDFPTLADTEFPSLEISAELEVRSGSIVAALPALASSGASTNDILISGDIVLPGLYVESYSAAVMDSSIPAISSSGSIYATLTAAAASYLPGFISSGNISVIPIIRLAGELPNLTISSSGFGGSFGSLSAALPSLRAYAAGFGGRLLTSSSTLPALEVYGTIIADVTGQGLLILPAWSMVAYGHYISATATFNIITMNTKRNAVTEYTNMPFNSIAQVGGEILALNGSNLYVFDSTLGDELVDNNRTNIPANFRTFRMDFFAGYGDVPNVLRKVREAWMLSRVNGNLRLTITDDELLVYTYDINDTNQFIHDTRVKFARGIKGRHFDFNIENVDGADFEVFSWRVKAEAFEHRRR